MPTTWYVRSTGNDGNDGTLVSPFLTILPACIGGAHEASSGDTIDCIQAQTIALGNNQAVLPAGVNLTGLDSTNTIITGNFMESATAYPVPVLQPGAGSVISNIKIKAINSGKNQVSFGLCYVAATIQAGVYNNTVFGDFTCNDCYFDGCLGFLWFGDENNSDTLGAIGKFTGAFNRCTIITDVTRADGVFSNAQFTTSLTAATNIGWDSAIINFTDCTVTAVWNSSQFNATVRKVCRGYYNESGTYNIIRGSVSATDATNTSGTVTNTNNLTAAISCGSLGRVNVFSGTLSSSKPNAPTNAFDVWMNNSVVPAANAQAILVGASYNVAKITGNVVADSTTGKYAASSLSWNLAAPL